MEAKSCSAKADVPILFGECNFDNQKYGRVRTKLDTVSAAL